MPRTLINKVSHYAKDVDGMPTIPKYRLNLTLSHHQRNLLNAMAKYYNIQPSDLVRKLIETNGRRLQEKISHK